MFEVKNADKKLLESLEKKEKAKKARNSKIVYGILKALGIVGTGVALVNFGVTGGIIAVVSSIVVVGSAWISKVGAKEDLDRENDKRVDLAVELASQLGVEVDAKNLEPELVATLDETEKATFVQDGEEIAYGDRGQKKNYYKYSDANGGNHLLEETTTYYDEQSLLPYNNLVEGIGGYTTMIRTRHILNGLEPSDEEALPREVVVQIANYEANKERETESYARTRKR